MVAAFVSLVFRFFLCKIQYGTGWFCDESFWGDLDFDFRTSLEMQAAQW